MQQWSEENFSTEMIAAAVEIERWLEERQIHPLDAVSLLGFVLGEYFVKVPNLDTTLGKRL
jgi:hypothetical protein